MRAIFMGKNKPSSVAALNYLLDEGVTVTAVVSPTSAAPDRMGLSSVAGPRGIPLVSDSDLYDALADPRHAHYSDVVENIDLVLSFLFWRVIRSPLIDLPRIGCINFHPAPLPELRGVGGYNFAILEQHRQYGVSAHFVDETIDTGDLIEVDRFEIDPGRETAQSLERRSQAAMVDLFQKVIDLILADREIPRTPQEGGRYIGREEFDRARQIHPEDDAETVARKSRAFWYPPHPGAVIRVDGVEFTVVSEAIMDRLDR